jgi:hypothetical protein
MPDVLRTFTVRNPVVLPARRIEATGIFTHPAQYQSARYQRWTGFCEANLRAELQSDILAFMRSTESIKRPADLGEPWSSIVDGFLFHGPSIPRQTAMAILEQHLPKLPRLDGGEHLLKNAIEKAERAFRPIARPSMFNARTALGDTILGLAFLKSLGDPDNADHQSMLRVLTFADRAVSLDMRLPETVIDPHFDRPILLPPCFFDLDPCSEKPRGTDFPFLRAFPATGQAPVARGCVDDGECGCKVNDECVDQRHCCATIKPYVVDLLVVRDTTSCYRAGDLSYIKNILAGETLSTKHRRLERVEEVTEREEEQTRNTERDLQIDDKSALQKEINETVKTDLAIEAGITANASWGTGVKYELTASSKFSFNKSKETALKEARDYSRNVIDRSISKLEEKVRTLARTTRTVETEETNEHGFSNTSGPNVSGQYLYVNKISKAQVFSYGKKAVLDLFLPEPAALYNKLLANKFGGIAPVPPVRADISAETITPENYEALVKQLGLKDVPAPPPFRTTVEVTLEGAPGDPKGKAKSGSQTFSANCSIPNDYIGVSMTASIIRLNYNDGGGVSIAAVLGPAGNNVSDQDGGPRVLTSSLPSIEGNHTVFVHTWDVTEFTWILAVECVLKDSVKAQWQSAVFEKVQAFWDREQEKYEKVLEKYLEEKKAFEEREAALKVERNNRNPFINRETERTELKRMAISYIACQFFDEFDSMKERVKPCGYPQMDIRQAEAEGLKVQFFEHAFDWSLMTYVFYRYFWGRKCKWPEKLREESGDLIYQQFLAAGSARVLVPIRDGFFDLVQYFLTTGEIWGSGGTPPMPNDPHYVSVAQEMKEQRGNYYADREGHVDVTNGSNVVTLNDSDWYWTYADPLASPPVVAGVDSTKVAADVDREIILDCKTYRIVDIQPNPAVTAPTSWLITLDRNYEQATAQKLQWSTGAVYVGAPWEFITPTTLTFLRDQSSCLPCYPLEECKEGE